MTKGGIKRDEFLGNRRIYFPMKFFPVKVLCTLKFQPATNNNKNDLFKSIIENLESFKQKWKLEHNFSYLDSFECCMELFVMNFLDKRLHCILVLG